MATDGTVKTWPKALLKLEGACIFGTSLWAYARLGQSWWVFGGILLLPDLGMAGYLADNTVGAAMYNAVHTETPPLLLLCVGLARRNTAYMGTALAWLAHIGMDRMFGFGLKYARGFGYTHLGSIGNVKKE